MSFDAWVVAFGLSRLLRELGLVQSNAAYLVLIGVGLLDTWLLYRFFANPSGVGPAIQPYEAAHETFQALPPAPIARE
jgi:hypothetical protein